MISFQKLSCKISYLARYYLARNNSKSCNKYYLQEITVDLARLCFLATKKLARSCTFRVRKASSLLQNDIFLQHFSTYVQDIAGNLLARSCLIMQVGFNRKTIYSTYNNLKCPYLNFGYVYIIQFFHKLISHLVLLINK